MIAALMLALAHWILGFLFALCAFCALGCVISLFLSILYGFRSPMRLVAAPLWAIFSFASLGAAWLIQWTSGVLAIHTGQQMETWFIIGSILPGIMGVMLVPRLIKLTPKPDKSSVSTTTIVSAKG